MIDSSVPTAKARPRIVLPEAAFHESTMRAGALAMAAGSVRPVFIGRREDIVTAAEALGIRLKGADCIYPVDDPAQEPILTAFLEKNPSLGLTRNHVRAMILPNPLLYAAGLLAIGKVEGIVTGAGFPAETVTRTLSYFFPVENLDRLPIMIVPQQSSPQFLLEAMESMGSS